MSGDSYSHVARQLTAAALAPTLPMRPVHAHGWGIMLSAPGAMSSREWILSAKREDRKEPTPEQLAFVRAVATACGCPESVAFQRPTDGFYLFWEGVRP